MSIRVIDEGVVAWRPPGGGGPLRVGARVVVLDDESLLCSYMTQSELGIADFTPTLASSPDGRTWTELGPVWPGLRDTRSMFCNISRAPGGPLYLYGSTTVIDAPGESFWSPETEGLKENRLIWARSTDSGRSWSEPRDIPMPDAGAAEVAGPMCVTGGGAWFAPYAPSRTFDADLQVDRARVVVLRSTDEGATWLARDMIRLEPASSTSAEAWVVELTDGSLVGACWHILGDRPDDPPPNAFGRSFDGGDTWVTGSIGTPGQSTSLTPLPEGRVALQYNRRHGEVGVWLAIARPTGTGFGIEQEARVWQPVRTTRHDSAGDHAGWTDFAFGEPASVLLPEGDLLVVFWCDQPDGGGVRHVRVRFD